MRRRPVTPPPSVIAYVDAPVLLRVALGQPDALPEWRQMDQGVSSALTPFEANGGLTTAPAESVPISPGASDASSDDLTEIWQLPADKRQPAESTRAHRGGRF